MAKPKQPWREPTKSLLKVKESNSGAYPVGRWSLAVLKCTGKTCITLQFHERELERPILRVDRDDKALT